MGKTVEVGRVIADVYYDDEDPNNKGWYAIYRYHYGTQERFLDDSQKVWHPEMPRRRNAESKALRIARAYARKLDRQHGGGKCRGGKGRAAASGGRPYVGRLPGGKRRKSTSGAGLIAAAKALKQAWR